MNPTVPPELTESLPPALYGKLLLTGRELAGRLGVSTRLIEKWVATGVIPQLSISPRLKRYELTAVLNALSRYQTAVLKK